MWAAVTTVASVRADVAGHRQQRYAPYTPSTRTMQARASCHDAGPHAVAGPTLAASCLQLLVMLLDVGDDVVEHSVLRLQMRLQLQALAEDRLGVLVRLLGPLVGTLCPGCSAPR